jgi:hypothetical protein
MTVLAFDTHEAANRFKAAGFTEAQVEALVEVTRMTTALPDISTLATKADLTGEISSLRSELKLEIAGLRSLIATTQVQTLAITLTSMAAMFTIFKLIH